VFFAEEFYKKGSNFIFFSDKIAGIITNGKRCNKKIANADQHWQLNMK
jgi:hypothetical protein